MITAAMGDRWHDEATLLTNPTDRFETGGLVCDTGLAGRRIIVDT